MRIRPGIPLGYRRQPVTQTLPATPRQVQPAMFRTAARPLTWRHWPTWLVSGWQHDNSGDGTRDRAARSQPAAARRYRGVAAAGGQRAD